MAAYQKFFQGYTEAKVPKRSGNGFRIVRIYTDPYHVHDMNDECWYKQKILFAMLTLVSIGLYLFAAFRAVGSYADPFVALPEGLSFFSLIFTLSSVIFYVSRPRKMTVYDYMRSHRHLRNWSLVSAVCLSCTAITNFVYLLFFARQEFSLEMLYGLFYLLSGFVILTIFMIEKKTGYREEFNDSVIPFYPDTEF